MPRDVPEHVPPVPAMALPAHAPDRRRREHRLCIETSASRRRDDDDDDDYANPCQFGDDDDDQHHGHTLLQATRVGSLCLSMVHPAKDV